MLSEEKERILRELWLEHYKARVVEVDHDMAAEESDAALVPVLERLESGFTEAAQAAKARQLEGEWAGDSGDRKAAPSPGGWLHQAFSDTLEELDKVPKK